MLFRKFLIFTAISLSACISSWNGNRLISSRNYFLSTWKKEINNSLVPAVERTTETEFLKNQQQIEKDVPRHFEKFASEQELQNWNDRLSKILLNYLDNRQDYCQGLNFYAIVLMKRGFEDDEVVKGLLLIDQNLPGYFDQSISGIRAELNDLKNRLEPLFTHNDDFDSLVLSLYSWFSMGTFIYKIPIDSAIVTDFLNHVLFEDSREFMKSLYLNVVKEAKKSCKENSFSAEFANCMQTNLSSIIERIETKMKWIAVARACAVILIIVGLLVFLIYGFIVCKSKGKRNHTKDNGSV